MSLIPLEDDSGLVAACINRDADAWSRLITKYSNLIFIAAENRLKKYGLALSRQDIEDIRQNIITSLWENRKLETVKNRNNIAYWLAVVSGNMAIEYLRKDRRLEPPKKVSLFDKIDESTLMDIIPSDAVSPSDEFQKLEISRRIEEALDKLTDKEKLIAKLNILYNKKYREIATMLNLPKGTVSSYMKRSRVKLKRALKDLQ